MRESAYIGSRTCHIYGHTVEIPLFAAHSLEEAKERAQALSSRPLEWKDLPKENDNPCRRPVSVFISADGIVDGFAVAFFIRRFTDVINNINL